MTNRYNILVIGSGLGGLLCGAILAKKGLSVCVLEKNKVIGGNLQNFVRKGCVFNTGMHFLGALDDDQILYKIFKYLKVTEKVDFVKNNHNSADTVIIGNKKYSIPSGFDKFKESLIRYFPDEKKGIEKYIEKIREIWDKNPILNLSNVVFEDYYNRDYLSENLAATIDQITENEELKSLLLYNNGLYAGHPEKTPFYIHALITYFFVLSSYRIKGGSGKLADALIQIIEEYGGHVLKSKKVEIINIKKGRAVSVKTSDNSEYFADNIISGIHPKETIKMTNEGSFRKAYIGRIEKIENSIGSFVSYVVFKKKSFKNILSNIYFHKTKNVWSSVYNTGEWPTSYMLYTTPDENDPEYAESAVIITFMNYDEVKNWENTKVGKRGKEYMKFKNNRAEKLIDTVNSVFPDFKSCIDSVYSSTPLTYRNYTGIPEGAMYGLVKDSNKPIETYISVNTKIPNLYLTGQNIGVHGILGVTVTALLTCANKIDINSLINEINNV